LVTPSLQTFSRPRGPRHRNRHQYGTYYPSLGFGRLQGLTMRCCCFEIQRLPGFPSLSAPSSRSRDNRDSRPCAARPQVFSTSRRAYDHRDLQVCSTLLALRGFDLQSLTTNRAVSCFQDLAPTPLSTSQGFHPCCTSTLNVFCPHDLTHQDSRAAGLLVPCGTGSPLRFQPTLKLCSRFIASRQRMQFHPPAPETTLLAFQGLQGISQHHLEHALPSQSSTLSGLTGDIGGNSPCGAPPLLTFAPCDSELSLRPPWIPRLLLPFRIRNTRQLCGRRSSLAQPFGLV
jgi:hypothetical protein